MAPRLTQEPEIAEGGGYAGHEFTGIKPAP